MQIFLLFYFEKRRGCIIFASKKRPTLTLLTMKHTSLRNVFSNLFRSREEAEQKPEELAELAKVANEQDEVAELANLADLAEPALILARLDAIAGEAACPEGIRAEIKAVREDCAQLFERMEEAAGNSVPAADEAEIPSQVVIQAVAPVAKVNSVAAVPGTEASESPAVESMVGAFMKPGHNNSDRKFVRMFTELIWKNVKVNNLDMAFVQSRMNMSHSTLYRKLKSVTGLSGNEIIRKVKLRHGLEVLLEGAGVAEAAYESGFNDAAYFRACFKDEYGASPSHYVKILNVEG